MSEENTAIINVHKTIFSSYLQLLRENNGEIGNCPFSETVCTYMKNLLQEREDTICFQRQQIFIVISS